MYSSQNSPHHQGYMHPLNFINHAGPQPFMPQVIPPAGQQGCQPVRYPQQGGQLPYTQNCYPHQGQSGYPPGLCQPQALQNPWEVGQGQFGYLSQPCQPQPPQNTWDTGQGQFIHLLQNLLDTFRGNDRRMVQQNVTVGNLNIFNNAPGSNLFIGPQHIH